MAATDKNIVITPNIGSTTADPKIVFSGADTSTSAQNITLQVYPTNGGTLSFEGSSGQLFSIVNSTSGTIFSVSDISGIPSIEVLDTGLIKLAQYSGNVLLGTGSDNGTDKLQVNGSILGTTLKGTTLALTVATGTAPLTVASTTLVSNLNTDMLDGLHLHTGTNNEANKVVRTDGNGYIQAGYIQTSAGNEGNNSSPPRVWGTNGSDSYLRTYLTSALSVGSVTNAVTFNNGGSGDASGTTYNGSAARTISYNTIGAPSTTGANASGNWNISAIALRQSDGTVWNNAVSSIAASGGRSVDLAPNTYNYGIFSEFKAASLYGVTGYYAGLITYASYAGTTVSGGDSSYQLLFHPSAGNSTSNPSLKFRAGIDTTWGSWNTLLHSGNLGSYSFYIGTTSIALNRASASQALTGISSISFVAEASDSASISTTVTGTNTFFDFNLADDNSNDWWRWRFTPSGSTVYDAMTLKPSANGIADLAVSGTITGTSSIIGSHTYTTAASNTNPVIKNGGNTSAGLQLQGSDGVIRVQLYGAGTEYGFLNQAWSNWDLRKVTGAALYMNNDTTYYLQTNSSTKLNSLTTTDLTVTNTISGSVSGSAGSVVNSITFNTSGGAAAGTTYNGSAAKTIDYSTVGAAASSHTHSIDTITDEYRIFNNMGDNHSTRTSFDAQGAASTVNFGWRYVQGNTNSPGVNSAVQYYSQFVGLGNDYAYSSYGMQIAYPRNVTNPYIAIRYEEASVFGAWQKISAGYADSVGSITNDTSTNADTFYPAMAYNVTSGALSSIYVSSTKLYFNPSLGTLNATNFNSLSDENAKENIATIDNALEKTLELRGVSFTLKETQQQSIGVVAQEIEKIIPEVVSTSNDGVKSVAYGNIVGLLIEAIKEQQAQISSLKQTVEELTQLVRK